MSYGWEDVGSASVASTSFLSTAAHALTKAAKGPKMKPGIIVASVAGSMVAYIGVSLWSWTAGFVIPGTHLFIVAGVVTSIASLSLYLITMNRPDSEFPLSLPGIGGICLLVGELSIGSSVVPVILANPISFITFKLLDVVYIIMIECLSTLWLPRVARKCILR